MAAERGRSTAEGETAAGYIERCLKAVREHLGMEIAYLAEEVEHRMVFRAVNAPGFEDLAHPGTSHDASYVYCDHILNGRLPRLIPDTLKEPLAAGMEVTHEIPVGSHVGVPIRRADGTAYGMFCCLSRRPRPSLTTRDLAVAEMFADLIAEQVNTALRQETRRAAIVARVRGMLDRRGFEIVYQPIFDLGANRPIGFEALSRFGGPNPAPPDVWFSEAEEVGLGVELEAAAIEAALRAVEALPPRLYVSLNTSAATILSGRLAELLADAPLERLVLEVTEHAEVEDAQALTAALGPLRQGGLKLAVDDAGAGAAGLHQIVRLRPDIVKLDISLTAGIDGDPVKRALTAAMVHFAAEMGGFVTAEGIERDPELEVLRTLGVHRGQGWLLGRPMPLSGAQHLTANR